MENAHKRRDRDARQDAPKEPPATRLADDDLDTVSAGLTNTGGTSGLPDVCLSRTG